MIVSSKRCYLNILTQLCDKKTLLNANYYIADVHASPRMDDSMMFNNMGQLEYNETNGPSSLSRHHIKYGNGEVDPSPFITNIMIGTANVATSPIDMFVHHLNSTDTLLATYNFLFRNIQNENGIDILIFNNEDIVQDYVHIVCGYLSTNFGCDITFIDPRYRPKIKGQETYKGNKEYAEKVIHDLRDAQLLIDFNMALSQVGYGESINNLTIYLNAFDNNQLMYLYQLLFPEVQLPIGQYSADHIKQIIIGRSTQNLPMNPFANLKLSDEYRAMIEEYDNSAVND